MPELDDLPPVDDGDVSDDDLLLLFEKGAVANASRRVTRSQLLQDVARAGGSISLSSAVIAALTATNTGVTVLTVNSRLVFPSAQGVQNIRLYEANEAVPTIGSGNSDTIDLTVTGATTEDYVSVTFKSALPDGLIVQAWVSAADTVQLKFYNASSGNISGASYDLKVMAIERYTP